MTGGGGQILKREVVGWWRLILLRDGDWNLIEGCVPCCIVLELLIFLYLDEWFEDLTNESGGIPHG